MAVRQSLAELGVEAVFDLGPLDSNPPPLSFRDDFGLSEPQPAAAPALSLNNTFGFGA